MRMLDNLKEVLDMIELQNEWEFTFVTDIIERKEQDENYTLSGKQFSILDRIHQTYCG